MKTRITRRSRRTAKRLRLLPAAERSVGGNIKALMKPLIVLVVTATGIIVSELWTGAFKASFTYFLGELNETTTGQVIESSFDFGGGAHYGPDTYNIEYAFDVHGVTYTSRLVAFEERSRAVEKRLQEYPVGKIVTVYYDATRPRYAVLEPGPLTTRVYLQLVFNLLIVPLITYLILLVT